MITASSILTLMKLTRKSINGGKGQNMPPAPKSNWNYLYDVFKKLREAEPGAKISVFARSHGVSSGACREAFRRIESKKTRTVRTKNTRTNARKEPCVFDEVSPEEATEIVKQISDPRLVGCHARVLSMLYRAFDRIDYVHKKQCEHNEDGTEKIKIETIRDVKDEYQAQREFIYVIREIMPFISEIKDRVGIEAVINNLQARTIDVTQAALEISKMGVNLPEALKIMLSKTPPVVIANNFEMTSTEELDQRALETIQQLKWQHEHFLAERRQEVIELKKELKGSESFAPEEGPNKLIAHQKKENES